MSMLSIIDKKKSHYTVASFNSN